ncbi:MAG: chemotaxis protein CheW [Cyanobacteria bacterium P01_H01_bin.121]
MIAKPQPNVENLPGDNAHLQTDARQQEGQRFLRFPLWADLQGVIPLASLQGVTTVQLREILPVPHVASHLLGFINWRGEATWIVDLASVVGGTAWWQRQPIPATGTGLLVQVEAQPIGLLVERIETVEIYDPKQRLPLTVSMLPELTSRFLNGYFLDSTSQMRMQLDLDAVVQALR